MADIVAPVWLPPQMVETGYGIPQVCSRHGQPEVTRKPMKFISKPPSWTVLLILITVLIAVIVQLALRKTVKSPGWPLCDQCVRERGKRLRVGSGLTLGSLPVGIAIGQVSPVLGVLVGFTAFLVGLGFWAASAWGVYLRTTVDAGTLNVVVAKPHPGFAAALPVPGQTNATAVAPQVPQDGFPGYGPVPGSDRSAPPARSPGAGSWDEDDGFARDGSEWG